MYAAQPKADIFAILASITHWMSADRFKFFLVQDKGERSVRVSSFRIDFGEPATENA